MMEAASWVALYDLKPWVKNPRKNDHAVQDVAVSLRRFGWGRPLVVGYGEWGEVLVAGHTTLKAALHLEQKNPGIVIRGAPGPRVAPVRRQEFATEGEAYAYALVDNKAAEVSAWDVEMLGAVVHDLWESGTDVATLGWDQDEIQRWTEPGPDEDSGGSPDQSGQLTSSFQVLVTCASEEQQAALLAELHERGLDVRSLIT